MTEITENQRKKIVKVEQLETFAELVDNLYGSPMGASGINHAPGQVPDPGATAGTSKFLCEDGTWKEVSNNDILGKIRVDLQEYLNNALANGDGLAGIEVSVQNITDNTSLSVKTWNGETLVFDHLQPLKNYRVAVQSKIGYKLDYAYQDVLNMSLYGDVTKTFKYEALEFTAVMKSGLDVEGGPQDSNIDRTSSGVYLVAQYGYGGNTVQSGNLHHGDKLLVPSDVDTSTITISSSSDVNGYSKTASVDLVNRQLVVLYDIPSYSGYIIIDQTSNDPAEKIIDEQGNTYTQGYTTPQVITAIRNMSHCYVQQSFSNDTITLKQLDDSDGTKYADGTTAEDDIKTKNVFMRLPYFYTKVSAYPDNKVKVEFYVSELQTASSREGWKLWGGNDLIGKYEAKCTDTTNSSNGTLQSVSGTTPTGSVSQANFKVKARNVGAGFTSVKWRHHNIMAILFYAYYGHTNCQELVGYGTNSNIRTTGRKNSLGMTDTTSSDGNSNNIVFWGLENWWGNKAEFIDNVVVNGSQFIVTEDDGTTRTVTQSSNTSTLYPNKLVLGDNLDTVAAPNESGGTSTTGYCDYQYHGTNTNRVACRSNFNNGAEGGVAYVRMDQTNSAAFDMYSSRLAYTGPIQIV